MLGRLIDKIRNHRTDGLMTVEEARGYVFERSKVLFAECIVSDEWFDRWDEESPTRYDGWLDAMYDLSSRVTLTDGPDSPSEYAVGSVMKISMDWYRAQQGRKPAADLEAKALYDACRDLETVQERIKREGR